VTDFKAEPDKGFDIPHGEISSIQTFVLVLNMPKDLRHWIAHLALINDKEALF
jgi:hypothetical protein